MSDQTLELKGSLFPLSVLSCADLSVNALRAGLSQKLAQAPAFFYQAPIVLNVADCRQTPDFAAIKQLFAELNLVLVGVCGAGTELKQQAQQAGLAALQLGKDNKAATKTSAAASNSNSVNNNSLNNSAESATVAMDAKIVEQTVRSGQQLYAKGTDLIVRGTVGAGAEVIADGNIHIYGTLRGKAIAGAAGDRSKRIFCYNLQAELVSIAGNYWLSESLQGEFWGKSTCIKLQDDQLVLAELG
ncbi:septum site-determining protein MinC [Rheinheimera sp. YQF-2]|uniref:Probable septum site-determining protein MinC n=1 Tax=Rheinheimera lutimaris TaxID=2740584 RepID=A0A7Y5EGG3_9GAMM|nr:septum site-determining protein MinC [Rheinheimera lutimaris]NRQ41324.1 septum site-determining protein MinC [Rheinheimera lutimaris]